MCTTAYRSKISSMPPSNKKRRRSPVLSIADANVRVHRRTYQFMRVAPRGGGDNCVPSCSALSNTTDTTIGTTPFQTMYVPYQENNSSRFISRVHATIVPADRGEGHFIVDLASTNGTFVNGQVLPPGHAQFLNHGDVVWLGGKRVWSKGKAIWNECVFVYQLRVELPSKMLAAAVEDVTCDICYKPFGGNQGRSIVPCGHTFCNACVTKLSTSGDNRCPSCRTTMGSPQTVPFRCSGVCSLVVSPLESFSHDRFSSLVPYALDLEAATNAVGIVDGAGGASDASNISEETLERLIQQMKVKAGVHVGKLCCSIRLVA